MRYLLSMMLLLSACAGAKPQSAPAQVGPRANAYYALEPGATWVYKATFLGAIQTRTVVMGPQQDGFFVDDAGGKLMYDGEGLRDERRYLLREPLAVGKSWKSVATAGVDERYEIIKAAVPCKTAQLEFSDCVEVRGTIAAERGATLENIMVFARDIGLVRMATTLVQKDKSRVEQVAMELQEFRRSASVD